MASGFIVETCHDGTDVCVRDATDGDLADEVYTDHDAALTACVTLAEELGCLFFDFSTRR